MYSHLYYFLLTFHFVSNYVYITENDLQAILNIHQNNIYTILIQFTSSRSFAVMLQGPKRTGYRPSA